MGIYVFRGLGDLGGQDVDARNKSRQGILKVVSLLTPRNPTLLQLLNRTAAAIPPRDIDMTFRSCFGCILAVTLLLGGSAVAGAALTRVHFPSLEDNGPGQPATTLDGILFLPPGDAKRPAVVFLHGCSALTSQGSISPCYLAWASELNRQGYAVLMVDSFAARNIESTCSLRASDPDQWLNVLGKRENDARGALRYLQAQPYILPDRIGVIGWSQGGGVVLMLVNTSRIRLPADTPWASFRAAVALYRSYVAIKNNQATG